MTEMGGRRPSPAPPCPPNPGLGLAAFRTSHSIGWVPPVDQVGTRSGRPQNLFFVELYSPSLCRHFSRIYSSRQIHPTAVCREVSHASLFVLFLFLRYIPRYPKSHRETAAADLHGKACRRSLSVSRRACTQLPQLFNLWAIPEEMPLFLAEVAGP